jgi:hypothetical protein
MFVSAATQVMHLENLMGSLQSTSLVLRLSTVLPGKVLFSSTKAEVLWFLETLSGINILV